eukprot:30497-Pelagococcus_subviridis.AAC.8
MAELNSLVRARGLVSIVGRCRSAHLPDPISRAPGTAAYPSLRHREPIPGAGHDATSSRLPPVLPTLIAAAARIV